MRDKITQAEFQRMLEDPTVPDTVIGKYLKAASGAGGPFNPTFEPNPELVEQDRFESALKIGNAWCRDRRHDLFRRRKRSGRQMPVIVSEGDSWFQFPFVIDDVIDHLQRDYMIWSLGAAGDTAQNMVNDNPEYMQALQSHADDAVAFLLSAAGNDVIGEDATGKPVLMRLLRTFVSDDMTPKDLIDQIELEKVIEQLRDAYMKVVATVRSDRRFEQLPILIHGYDYAMPFPVRPGDPRGPFWAADDEWLGGPMKEKGIRRPKHRLGTIRILIDTLYDMLSDVAATDPHVHVVDVRDTLTRLDLWADEIHGTSKGFKRVAAKFRGMLTQVVDPGRRPESFSAGSIGSIPTEDGPDLLIGRRVDVGVDTKSLGLGDPGRFANGFRRLSAPEATIGEDDSVPFRFLSAGAARGRAVCKIVSSGRNFRGNVSGGWSGTGFLVGPNLLLTNHHVINSLEVARNARAIFDYEENAANAIADTTEYTLNPDRLFLNSPFEELDYCVVWVDGAPHERYGQIELWRGSFMAAPGASANVIHHPNGQPKRASLEKNEVIQLGLEEVLVHYVADTAPGSSGSPVFTDAWRLFALHHASTRQLPPELRNHVEDAGYDSPILNEGIKTSAIAIDLERQSRQGPNHAMAAEALALFSGSDSRMGYFGALGRPASGGDGLEVVVDAYRGTATDIDIAFWNVEWFNRNYRSKLDDVTRIIADLNLDIWAFEETSPEATEALVEALRRNFDMAFAYAASEPNANNNLQTTTVIWNTRTVRGERLEWPTEIDALLRMRSDAPSVTRFEAVEGQIFNRYPGLFRFSTLTAGAADAPFDFNLVPVHLKAKDEGSKRRRMASNVLAEAIRRMQGRPDGEGDWVIGGDFNAELATGQFDGLIQAGLTPLSAADERGGAITYLGDRFKSLIDSIFLSPGLNRGVGADDFMILAPDRADPGYIDRVSDHRPVMVRLSIGESPGTVPVGGGRTGPGGLTGPNADEFNRMLRAFLDSLRDDPAAVLDGLGDLLRSRG